MESKGYLYGIVDKSTEKSIAYISVSNYGRSIPRETKTFTGVLNENLPKNSAILSALSSSPHKCTGRRAGPFLPLSKGGHLERRY